MSLAQTDYCRQQGFDPQSPLCAHIILSGSVMEVPTHTLTQSLSSTLWPSLSFLPPGERDRGAVCQEGSVQSPPGDDRLAVWPQLVLCQVRHHTGTTVVHHCCWGWLNITLWPEQRSHMKSIFSFYFLLIFFLMIFLFHLLIFIYQLYYFFISLFIFLFFGILFLLRFKK